MEELIGEASTTGCRAAVPINLRSTELSCSETRVLTVAY